MKRNYLNPSFGVEHRAEKTNQNQVDLPLKPRQSKYMLVVPNRHTSVYTRLWCGYEAYLGFAEKYIEGDLPFPSGPSHGETLEGAAGSSKP